MIRHRREKRGRPALVKLPVVISAGKKKLVIALGGGQAISSALTLAQRL